LSHGGASRIETSVFSRGICAALADPLPDTGQTVFGDAPIGHLQPRAPEFLPDSAAEQAEQKRESDFDAKDEEAGNGTR
jgi:hypothetical protein